MKKIVLYIGVLVLIVLFSTGYMLWGVKLEKVHVVKTDCISSEEWVKLLKETSLFESAWSWSCWIRRFHQIGGGQYTLPEGLSAWEMVALLRQGDQSSYLIRTDETRTLYGFCESLSEYLIRSKEQYLLGFCKSLNLDTSQIQVAIATTYLFADSYDFQYSDEANEVGARFKKMHDDFWNEERMMKAKDLNLTPEQVYILASIVKGECRHMEEAPKIAGLYLNRLNKNMLLQCDATVQFIVERENAKRILNTDLEIVSPYNTYKVTGLPPGPIYIVEKKYIDAVLNYDRNNYIYMCAKSDGSGWHLFTDDYSEHTRNANAYRSYVQSLNIKK